MARFEKVTSKPRDHIVSLKKVKSKPWYYIGRFERVKFNIWHYTKELNLHFGIVSLKYYVAGFETVKIKIK